MKLELAHRQEVIVVSKLAIQQYLPQRQTSQPHGYAFLLSSLLLHRPQSQKCAGHSSTGCGIRLTAELAN